MLRLFARRAAPALLRQPQQPSIANVSFARAQRWRGYCDAGAAGEAEGAGESEEEKEKEKEKAKVVAFLEALDIDPKYEENIEDFQTLLYEVKTEKLKKDGMTVKERKKLLSHIEKYKRGLWAPKELRTIH